MQAARAHLAQRAAAALELPPRTARAAGDDDAARALEAELGAAVEAREKELDDAADVREGTFPQLRALARANNDSAHSCFRRGSDSTQSRRADELSGSRRSSARSSVRFDESIVPPTASSNVQRRTRAL